MKALTREAIKAIMPILNKDATARKALVVYARGEGTLSSAAVQVRKHAARIYDEGKVELTHTQHRQLMQFIVDYGRPGHAAMTGESRTEQLNVLFTPSELDLLKHAAKAKRVAAAKYVHEATVRQVREDLGLEDGI